MGLIKRLLGIKNDPEKPDGLRTDANTVIALSVAAAEDPEVTAEQRIEIADRFRMVVARADAFEALRPNQQQIIRDGSGIRTRQRHGLPPEE